MGTALTLTRHAFTFLAGLGWAVLVARALGAEGAGWVAIGMVAGQTAGAVLHLGLPWAIAHQVAGGRWDPATGASVARRVAATLVGALTPAAFGLAWLAAAAGGPDAWLAACAGLVAAPALAATAILGGVLHGALRFAAHGVVSGAPWILSLAVGLGLLASGRAAPWTLLAAWIGSQFAVAAWLALRLPRGARIGRTGSRVREALAYGWRVQVGELASLLRSRLDHLILAAYAGPAPVGLYFAAVRLVERLSLVSQAAMFSLFPIVARRETSAEQARRFTLRALAWSLGGALAGATLVAALAGPLVRLLFGEEFEGAVPLVLVLLPGAVALSVSRVWTGALLGHGRAGLVMRIALSVAAVAVALNLLWVPRYGAAGAAAAASVSAGLNALLRGLAYRRLSLEAQGASEAALR